MYPTPPFTPRAAGSYPQRQPTSSLASWFDAGSSSADYRPRTVHGGHGRPRITRRFFVGEGALQPDRARGRERVVAKTTVGCPKHYDVMLDADDGVEYSGDHVRYRYVDFLTSRPLDDGAAAAEKFESTQAVATWLDTSHPHTRLDAYPLFILAKDVIRRLLRHEIHSHDSEKIRIALELSKLKAQLTELNKSTGTQLADYRKRCNELDAANQRLNELKLKAEAEWSSLNSSFQEHKRSADKLSKSHDELKRRAEAQQRQHLKDRLKLMEELDAAHSFDEAAAALTLEKLMSELDEFSHDGRDHHTDKLLLLRRLCCTFSQEEHPEVLKAVFFALGDWDVAQLPAALKEEEQRDSLLRALLAGGAEPKALFDRFAEGSAELTDAATAMQREALGKGCDVSAVMALLEAELGRDALMAMLRGEVAEAGNQWEPPAELQPEPDQQLAAEEPALPPLSKNLRFLHKEHKGVSPLTKTKAHGLVGTIYEKKALSDQTDDTNNHKRTTMPDFLRSWSLAHFGLRNIANKSLAALCVTVRENEALGADHSDFDMRLKTFGYLSGISSSPYEHTELPANFCIDLLRRIFKGKYAARTLFKLKKTYSRVYVTW